MEYHGLRQPCFNQLDVLLDSVEAERPAIWNYLTDGGEIWDEKIDLPTPFGQPLPAIASSGERPSLATAV